MSQRRIRRRKAKARRADGAFQQQHPEVEFDGMKKWLAMQNNISNHIKMTSIPMQSAR